MKLPSKKKLIPAVKLAVFLFVLFGLFRAAVLAIERWDDETSALSAEIVELRQLAASERDPVTAEALVVEAERRASGLPSFGNVRWDRVGWAGLLYAAGLIPPGWVLHRCLVAFKIPCSRRRAIAAQLLGHAGKYIPGKAVVVVLRVGAILPRSNVEAGAVSESEPKARSPFIGRATTCVFFETLLMMGVGGAVAGVLLWNSPLPVWVRSLALLMAIGSVIPVSPPVLRRVIEWIAARRERKTDGTSSSSRSTSPMTWRLLGWSYLVSLVSWILIGLSFAVLVTAIPSLETTPPLPQLVPIATAAIALGMVLGFASLLPGGAGVREYVTLLVLVPVIGQTHALLAVIAARLLFIVVEAILAALASLSLRRTRLVPEGS